MAYDVSGAGVMVRDWRQRRRFSQLELSARTGVSTRHLSFIETGRSRPSREMISRLGEALEMPLREQRALFSAAGFTPDASEAPLDAPELAHVSAAIEAILRGHEPYPALVIDGGWDLIAANDAAYDLLSDIPPELLEPPVNVVRLSLDPNGLGDRIINRDDWADAIGRRIRHEYEHSADPRLRALLDVLPPASQPASTPDLVLTLRIGAADRELSFITTTTVFGTPRDVTVADLAIEALYPADDATRAYLTSP